MLNIDHLYSQLSSIDSGETNFPPSFAFSIGGFVKDWIGDRSRNWEESLKALLEYTNKLVGEFEQSEVVEFETLTEFETKFPDTFVHQEFEDLFPKKASGLFEEYVLCDKEGEKMYVRQQQGSSYRDELLKIRTILDSCIEKYRAEKDFEIHQPTYHLQDRIPFFGNEHQLAFFFDLLIDGGFVLASDTQIQRKSKKDSEVDKKNNLRNNILGDDFVDTLEGNKLTAFKKHLVKKKELSQRVSDYFYCVDPQLKSGLNGFEIIIPKQNNVKSKMSSSTKNVIASSDRDRFIKGFRKILENLE